MKEFTQAVGGDAIHVVSLIPEGTEPHGFSPTADQMKTLHNAKLLIVHGLGMEPWAQKIAETSGNPNLIVVEASKGVTPIPWKRKMRTITALRKRSITITGPMIPTHGSA